MLNSILYGIKELPTWVWAILLYLLFMGIRAINTRIVYLPKIFIVPSIFLATKYNLFLSEYFIVFILIITFGSILSFIVHRNTKIEIIKNSKSIKLPGTYFTLFLLMSLFIVKCYFGYLHAAVPELAIKYLLLEITIDGLFVGYLLGRSIRYTYKYVRE